MKKNITLIEKELCELVWYIERVQAWGAGGPYGDGENIYNKKGYNTMNRVLAKLDKVLQA